MKRDMILLHFIWFVLALNNGLIILLIKCTCLNVFQHLRLIRHPCILTYVQGQEDEEGPQLCTEKAIPLGTIIQDLTPTEISAGLYNILEALSFLHEKVIFYSMVVLKSIFCSGWHYNKLYQDSTKHLFFRRNNDMQNTTPSRKKR